jgi:hypothetical protein
MAKTTKQSWRPVFLDFISHMTIQSKEIAGDTPTPLSDVLYGAQIHYLDQICDGLDHGIHRFCCLKARQLGISTISLAVDVFWITVHAGTQGALVVDTEPNRENFRTILESYIVSLPAGLRVGIRRHNRNQLLLNNGSKIDYLVAGKRDTNKTLGQSRALNFLHCTEVGSWGSSEGAASLFASLAEKHPHRLYMFESTAHGKNLFYQLWKSAKMNPLSQRAIFCGWWLKEDYRIERWNPLFKHYWTGELDEGEEDMIAAVKETYGYTLKPEQIVWHRHKRTNEMTDDDIMDQNFPSTEEVAFVVTGRGFFSGKRIKDDQEFIESTNCPLKAYRYYLGDSFLRTTYEQVMSTAECDLRVWEEADAEGVYCMGIDPSYGRSENNDRSAIEIFRCYADRLVQVAEYATSEPESYQVAWVMAHLAGLYKNVWINLELNGSGTAIMGELKQLRQLLNAAGLQKAIADEQGNDQTMAEVLNCVRWYLYRRPDTPGPGYVFNWRTNQGNKHTIFNQGRDAYHTNLWRIRSLPLLGEMEFIIQDGDHIGGDGHMKDDRTFATMLANKTWIDWVRPGMLSSGETFDVITKREAARALSPETTMVGAVVKDFFRLQEQARLDREDFKTWNI